MFVSQETLKAANSGYHRDTDKSRDTKLKNASRNEKPAWLETFVDSIGSDYIPSNSSADEEEDSYKQASSRNNNEMPNWLITYRNTVGF